MVNYAKIECGKCATEPRLSRIENYANFMLLTPTISMFIPCDEEGKILYDIDYCMKYHIDWDRDLYNKAKEKVLFDGFYTKSIFHNKESFQVTNNEGQQICIYKSIPNYFIWNYETIEGLSKLGLTLTESAIKTYRI